MKFLWEVGALRDKKCSPRGNCFLWTVLPGSGNFFDEIFFGWQDNLSHMSHLNFASFIKFHIFIFKKLITSCHAARSKYQFHWCFCNKWIVFCKYLSLRQVFRGTVKVIWEKFVHCFISNLKTKIFGKPLLPSKFLFICLSELR